MKTCMCCGQTLPPRDPVPDFLTPLGSKLFRRVRRAGLYGIPAEVLFNHLYGDRPDGGPLGGLHSMAVVISQANFHLKRKLRRMIRKDGTHGNYVLIDISLKGDGRRFLKPDDVRAIRATQGETQLQLAERYGVSQGSISMVRTGKTHTQV